MTRILASGDHHFDASSPRWEECQRIHDWIAARAETEKPDLFLSAGDLYERASTPVEREVVATWLTRIADVCPVVMVRGNHDASQDLALLRRLKARHPITVEERAAVHVVAGVAVACLAWPSRSSLAASMPGATTAESLNDGTRGVLGNVLRGLGLQLQAHDGPTVLLSHAMVDGSVTSVGQPLVGCESNVSLTELGLAGAHATVLGHIHKPQDWAFDGRPIMYTGSPFRTAFGEVEQKSILSAEWSDERGLASWSRILTPATPMVLLTADYLGDGAASASGFVRSPNWDIPEGCEARLRYRVEADQREAARAAVASTVEELLLIGAKSVKVEEVVRPKVRARTPEIATADSLGEKLDVLWDAREPELDAERRTRLKALAQSVETEVRGAA